MAIIGNIVTEIGDVILFGGQAPLLGTIALNTWTDDVLGETPTRFFDRKFRYSLDGVIFSPWLTLENAKLQSVQLTLRSSLYIQYRYERSGTDTSGALTFNSVTVNGEFLEPLCNYPAGFDSSFADIICNDPEQIAVCVNLTEKAYGPGIVPQTLIRNREDPQKEDVDYIAYWKAISCYVALLVVKARQLLNFNQIPSLVRSFLSQRGLFVPEGTQFTELQHLQNFYYDCVRQRGTLLTVLPKGSLRADGSVQPENGEFLRLAGYGSGSRLEFVFGLCPVWMTGFNMTFSGGGEYRGLTPQNGHLNKYYESSENVLDLGRYPLVNPANVSLAPDTAGGPKNVMKISGSANTNGAGVDDTSGARAITVSRAQDYEFVMELRQPSPNGLFSAGFRFFNAAGSLLSTFFCIEKRSLNVRTSLYYHLRCILYRNGYVIPAVNEPDVDLTSLGVGQNAVMPNGTHSVVPFVIYEPVSGGEIFLWNLKFRPLALQKGQGFLGGPFLINVWAINGTGSLSNGEIERLAERYLFPCNTKLMMHWLAA